MANKLNQFFILTDVGSIKRSSSVDPVENHFLLEHVTHCIPHFSSLINVTNMIQMFTAKRLIYGSFGFQVLFHPDDKGSIIVRSRCKETTVKILDLKLQLSFLLLYMKVRFIQLFDFYSPE